MYSYTTVKLLTLQGRMKGDIWIMFYIGLCDTCLSNSIQSKFIIHTL